MMRWCMRLVNDQIKKKRETENALLEVFSNKACRSLLMNEHLKIDEKLSQTLGFLELYGYKLPPLKLEMEFVPHNLRGRSLFHIYHQKSFRNGKKIK